MYSESIIESTLDEFYRQDGWRPEPHTPEQVDEFIAYVDAVTDVVANSKARYISWKGKAPKPERVQWIRRWIENEQKMCFASAEYFVTRYARIRDVEERVVHFNHRLAQRIFHNALAECDDKQKAIQLFILKARQLGCSTVVALYFLHRILFRSNTYAVMASVQAQQSEKLAAMIETTWTKLPFWLPPAKTILKAKEPKWANGSALSVQSGTQEVGIAQGTTPTCLIPTALVRTANGFTLPISSLNEGDEIITHSGKLSTVLKSFKTRTEGDFTKRIKLWGNYEPLECTLDHRILTPDGWCEAQELCPGEYVSHPIRKIIKTVDAITVTHRKSGNAETEVLELPLDFDLGYVSGLYLAEGSIHNAKNLSETVFTVHWRELDDRVERVRRILNGRWRATTRAHNDNGAQIKVYCSWLDRWLDRNFGRRMGKQVPDWVFDAGEEFCRGLLKGYMDGDGHLENPPGNNVKAPTVCYQIAYQMRDLIASLGFGWASIYYRPSHEYNGMKKKDVWWLVLSGPVGAAYRSTFGLERRPCKSYGRHWRYSPNKQFMYVMIESVSDGWSDYFWDIEVNHDDHSFTTTQCSVHNCIHISEVGDYANPKRVLEEGLFPACHQTKALFMVLEGTGSMANTWQKEKWEYYTKNLDKGGRFTPFFIPPACARDLYPPEDWLRANPIPLAWEPSEETRRMRRRGELFVRSTDYLWKVLGQRWEMDREFQWYWECLYKEAVASHSERQMLAQFAPTPDDAFQSENTPVFSKEVIELVTTNGKVPYKAYAVTGRTILMGDENRPYRPDDADVDWTEPNLKVSWEADDGNSYEWEFVPLKAFDDSKDEACFDKLLIFEPPEDGAEYAVSIDTAHGLNTPNEDRASLKVRKNGKGVVPDVEVACFTSIRVNSPQMARIAAAIAVLYCTDGNGNITSANPLLCRFVIEQVRKAGDECQHQLKIMGFLDHHPMHRYDNAGNIVTSKATKEGWFTQPWSRPILLDRYVEAINTGWVEIHDPIERRQLSDFERKYKGQGGKPFMEHAEGSHDDNIFSGAMNWTTLHDLENTALRIASKYKPPKREEKHQDLWCTRAIVLD